MNISHHLFDALWVISSDHPFQHYASTPYKVCRPTSKKAKTVHRKGNHFILKNNFGVVMQFWNSYEITLIFIVHFLRQLWILSIWESLWWNQETILYTPIFWGITLSAHMERQVLVISRGLLKLRANRCWLEIGSGSPRFSFWRKNGINKESIKYFMMWNQ